MKILWPLPMFTSIKAKLNMYKWTFVICTFFGLSVIAGIQFFQIKNMKLVNTHSQETIEEQKEEIKKLASKVSEQEIRRHLYYSYKLSRIGKLSFAIYGRMGRRCTRPITRADCKRKNSAIENDFARTLLGNDGR